MSKSSVGVTGTGFVVSVKSGDTFVIQGSNPTGGPAPLKQISISGIAAPLIANGKSGIDKPFAFHSREYLRKRILGKIVSFKINYVMSNSSADYLAREYADCQCDGQDLAAFMVAAGWATVKAPSSGAEGKIHADKQLLIDLQARADSAGIGQFQKNVNPEDFVREVDWNVDGYSFYRANKNAPLPGVIDKVVDGSTYRIELIGSSIKNHAMITLYVCGISAPNIPLPMNIQNSNYKRRLEDGDSNAQKPIEEKEEPFAGESKSFVERRLLNKDVRVLIHASDKYGNLFGTVQFPRGNIAIKLVEEGLATVVSWSAAVTPDGPALRQAEMKAIRMRNRLYANYQQPSDMAQAAQVTGQYKVIQVLSGDTIIAVNGAGEEQRFLLASILAPRQGSRARNQEDKPYAYEAKEFLRGRLIGQKVQIVYEYSQPATAGASGDSVEQRIFVSVFQNKDNVNAALVSEGLASVTPHRRTENRAANYDALLAAEADAERRRVGKHSTGDYNRVMIDLTARRRPKNNKGVVVEEEVDNSRGGIPARGYLDQFTSQKQISGVVEYVFNASKLKVVLPKFSVIISLALANVRAPAREVDGKANEFAAMGSEFVKSLLLQRDIKLDIEAIDKGDNFIGNIYFNKNNLAVQMVKEGLLTVYEPSARRAGLEGDALLDAEKEAKAGRKGLWRDYDPSTAVPVEDAEEEDQTPTFKLGDEVAVVVTELADISNFYVQFPADPNVSAVNAALAAFNAEVGAPDETTYVPKKGQICAGYFQSESQYFRVRNEGGSKGEHRVIFIDFGNRDVLRTSQLRELPEALAAFPPLAHSASLAGLRSPADTSSYYFDCANAFNGLVFEKKLNGRILNVNNRQYEMVLTDSGNKESINAQIAARGFAKLPRRPSSNARILELQQALQDAVAAAQDAHYGLWEYGDVSDDGEDEQTRWGSGRVPSEQQRKALADAKASKRTPKK